MPKKIDSRFPLSLLLGALSSFLFLANFSIRAQSVSERPKLPESIDITQKISTVTIPDVPRDEVICFALYTVQDQILKLSAQLYPLQAGESREVHLEINRSGDWKRIATEQVNERGWMATFRVENWEHSQDWPYRVVHSGGASFGGRIRRNPTDEEEIIVAAFTGNSNRDRTPRTDIIRNVQHHDPDLLFFSGDQSYDHERHTAAWLLFGRQFGEIIKDRPTITIPDDHDVGQGNVWGEGGKVSNLPGGSDGGYIMSADYVNMVQRAQTNHLPDPYDPTPIEQGITVYYTSLNVGGIDFAIVEDRKWKTGPAGLIPQQGPRPDHVNNSAYDPQTIDVPEAILLGERQLSFLHEWGQDWEDVTMKAVLSQTIFAGGAHIHGKYSDRLHADLDSNGWPQSGRARALGEMRRCFAFHLAGDQHLATVIHHGVHSWEDAGYSYCVPSIVNYYGRWWWPLEKPEQHLPESTLPYTGRYYDGFRNKVTMQAYANPTKANYKGAGYALVRFNKNNRKITMECWPRHIDVASAEAKQYPGWPITIDQVDNYGRQAMAYLPTLNIEGPSDAVVTVIDEAQHQVVYSLRIRGNSWRPKVFREATYTVKVEAKGKTKTITGIQSEPVDNTTTLNVQF